MGSFHFPFSTSRVLLIANINWWEQLLAFFNSFSTDAIAIDL
jgi:hypothetical protein